jgi:CRP-like cAMP-binding protein
MSDDPLFQRFGRASPRGTVLFREGELGQEMYVIQQGRVTISKRAGEMVKVLSQLGPGEFLGEMAFLNDRPRSATATCADDCRLLVVEPKTFEAMVRTNAEIAVRLIKKLAARLAEADDQIQNLLISDAATRVVHFLTTAAERGERSPSGTRVAVPPRELAARVGVRADESDEALMKLLKAKVIEVHPDGFLVPEVGRLRNFLEFLQLKVRFGEAG